MAGSPNARNWPNGDLGGYGDLSARSDHIPLKLAVAAPRDGWTIVDLRPLRALYGRLARGMSPEERDAFRRWIFGYDAALFVGRMHQVTWTLNPGVAY